ncbi:hypothetical protein KGQ64_16795 [bacterium]|nr:hypothetical protein [bacterium]
MREKPWQRLARELRAEGFESPYLDRLEERVDVEAAQDRLEKEIVQEMACALGRAEEKLLVALLEVELAARDLDRAGDGDGEERAAARARFNERRDAAWQARHELLIHREAIGIRRNQVLETLYPVPPRR